MLQSRLLPFVVLGATAFAGCKARHQGYALRGFTGNQTTKTIDYTKLLADGATLNFANFVAYESSYKFNSTDSRQLRQAGPQDQGTVAAIRDLWWLEKSARPGIFGSSYTVETNTFPCDFAKESWKDWRECLNTSGLTLGQMYRYSALAKGVAVSYLAGGQTVHAKVDVRIQVVLGASLMQDADLAEPDTAPQQVLDFYRELSQAMTHADVITYNTHLERDGEAGTPFQPAPVDANTVYLKQQLTDLGGRTKYGLIYINSCNGETIERELMGGLLADREHDVEPILISHRNYSNYGFFAEHDANIILDVLGGRPLPRIMLDLTTTLRQPAGKGADTAAALTGTNPGGLPTEPPPAPQLGSGQNDPASDGAAAAKKLAEYYAKDGVLNDSNAVVVVAYDILDRKLQAPVVSETTDETGGGD